MFISFLIMLFISTVISIAWAISIHKETEYRKQNPDYKPGEGWLDWDEPHTEGEI